MCLRCGFRRERTKYMMGVLVVTQIVGVIIYVHTKNDSLRYVGSAQAASQVPPLDFNARAGWSYYLTTDQLVSDITRHARVLSRGNLAAGKAENNGTTGVLELRASPTYGNSVLITLKHAAFDTVDETCTIHAQFDADPVSDFTAGCSTDGHDTSLIVKDVPGFTARVKAGAKLALDVALSKNVDRVMMFDIAGLKWK